MLIRPIHQELELWKWVAMISLAVALAMAFATAIAASDAPNKLVKPEYRLPRGCQPAMSCKLVVDQNLSTVYRMLSNPVRYEESSDNVRWPWDQVDDVHEILSS